MNLRAFLGRRLTSSLLIAATFASSRALGQSPMALILDQDGQVACIVSREPVAALVTDPPGMADPNVLVLEIRAPGSPVSVSKLPPRLSDFSRLPVKVYLLPPGHEAGKSLRVEAQVVDAALTRGVTNTDVFARVRYSSDLLKPGVEIIAERTAVADNGEKVISRTRCRIREADAARWR